ncbi:MAG: bifunctional adenosylcobinamide kinase/adenosylcobinamide-phosphate guanylyltransferase [Spirochaetaceae bacterium]|jgi:adenosylcobinamide kinase/adenosylcobinamide-phosphate guanylyltransferase|nr:bifunctional adenosylcobinamide kinase/adenosylcobinamide-phosphate guanylyltransferase [Spirochaetaceae bacterium]
MITLITGGVKAGKSRRALDLGLRDFPRPITFIATAEKLDREMDLRISRHQEERRGLGGFVTVEEPLALDAAIAGVEYAIVDCIPMWVNNLIFYGREDVFSDLLDRFIRGIRNCIIVTNETGLGVIPFDEGIRRYNTLLAEANRRIAGAADVVELMIAGLSLRLK